MKRKYNQNRMASMKKDNFIGAITELRQLLADVKFNKKVKKKYNFAKSHMKKFFDKDQIKEFTKISKKNYCDRKPVKSIFPN